MVTASIGEKSPYHSLIPRPILNERNGLIATICRTEIPASNFLNVSESLA